MHNGVQYRPEIDGLRAIAVLAVIIFHAKLGFLPGGFVGVDVFFVISGYLIASIILNAEKKSEFSLAQFYERRIRRIFPALFVVVISCLAIGYFYFTPYDYSVFAGSAQATMAFYSNLYFARTTGYFQPAADSQLLLHTWSLGVEEQFYLVAPFLLLLIHRKAYRYRALIIVSLIIASLAASLHGIYIGSLRAFYMPHTRAFELLIGVALAMNFLPSSQNRATNETLSFIGLAMIVGAILLLNKQSPFPGFLALIPTIGTALIIHANTRDQTRVGHFLSAKPFIGVGKISYSLYLWHWPLLAFGDYEWGAQITSAQRIALLGLAFILSYLTYRYIEQPARNATFKDGRKKVFAAGFATILICAAASQLILLTNGLPQRLSPEVQALVKNIQNPEAMEACHPDPQRKFGTRLQNCSIGIEKSEPGTFMIIGDSHATSLVHVLAEHSKAEGVKGYNLAVNGCAPFLGLREFTTPSKHCSAAVDRIEEYLKNPAVKDVIIAGRWAAYTEAGGLPDEMQSRVWQIADNDKRGNRVVFDILFKQTVDRMIAMGKRVTIVGPAPELNIFIPKALVKGAMKNNPVDITNPRSIFDGRQKYVLPVLQHYTDNPNVTVIFPHQKLCDAVNCFGSRGNSAFYYDDDHLSADGGRLMNDEFQKVFARMR